MKQALLKESKTKLLDLIKSRGEVSVDEATAKLGLAKTTVRQHLLLLEKQELITSKDRTRSVKNPGKGRPQKVYQLSKEASVLFPTQEPALLRELLSELIGNGQLEWVNKFFINYWDQRTQKFQQRLKAKGKATPQLAQETLLELLQEEGFMPEIKRKKDGSVTVRECNCPFPEAIKATKIPCQLEALFLNKTLNTNFERISYIPAGSTTCTYTSKGKAINKK